MTNTKDKGFVLVSTMLLITVLLAMMGAYFTTTRVELATTRSTHNSIKGFYAAEAGLNLRAEEIRQVFVGYNRPDGTSPTEDEACEGSNLGSGDFACEVFDVGNHLATTYITEEPDNPIITTIPPGERYQNLNAQEYRYTVRSVASNSATEVEAILDLKFKSRLVPLFQFVAFYNKDLEILPGPTMNLSGPVHTNGDLYLNAETALNITGQVTTAGSLFRGRKNTNLCNSKPVTVKDPINPLSLVPSCSTRVTITNSQIVPYNGMIQMDVTSLTVPEPEALDADPGRIYWDKADLRIVLELDVGNNPIGIQVRNNDDTIDNAKTTDLNTCPGLISGKVVNTGISFFNNREGKLIRMLEIDMVGLLNCIDDESLFGAGKGLDDDSEGGIVFHFTVKGPDSASTANNYGVRIRNADQLQGASGSPLVKGMTVVSDQAVYTHGHYNRTNKIPAAILADSINILSTNWNLNDAASLNPDTNTRIAANTTVYTAILAGTDTTGDIEGVGGQGGAYNGGLENYPRFHEKWTSKTLTYRGSFVSLNLPRHVSGKWIYGNPQYQAPNRNWDYDTDFNDAAKLPPLTPRFVYLSQELFVREWEQ
ncbi:MAG: pilus assembly PilX N-terminal domain-containing protein [Deltaproteobacteria bacterium]|nr:pilus assembly PilX N-terminal domain-containing protein [Deltaproteobacteria bacterium]